MNKFLQRIRDKKLNESVPMEIEGEDYIYIEPSKSEAQTIVLKSRMKAEESYGLIDKDLKGVKLTKEEVATWKREVGAGAEAHGIPETMYEMQKMRLLFQEMSILIAAYCVRYPDGSRLWDDPEEAHEVGVALFELEGTEAEIKRVQLEIESKKKTSNTSAKKTSTRSKKSSTAKG